MYKFIQKNQKKMLAIFAVGLMIVFILPYGLGQQGSQGEDSVVAHLGDEPLYASEFERARMEWEVLERLPTRIPIALALLSEKIGPQAAEAVYVSVKENEGHYLLLQKEATRAGLRTTDEEVDIYYDQISRLLGEGATRQREQLRAAIRGLLLVRHGMARVADNVKVSRPMVDHHLASLAQRITLRVVEFDAEQFAAAMPAPPDSVLREQFQRWREVPAGVATSDNPFGFGYRLPNRVKLQYVTIPRDRIEQAVRGQQDEFKWEVLARRYYNEHHDEFVRMPPEESPPTTQSTTAPATGPSTQPVATAAPTTGPSTQAVATTEPADTQPSLRPFAEVREDALEQVLRPRVDELMAEVTGAVTARLAADWEAHQRSGARPAQTPPTTTGPATTRPGAAAEFGTFAYLERLAAEIQREHGVLPSVTSIASEWKDDTSLRGLPGIGDASIGDTSFAQYVATKAEAFVPEAQRNDPSTEALSLLEPSPVLSDGSGDAYVFQLTDADAAHAPADMSQVADRLASDARTARAYDAARAEARRLLDAARAKGLTAAAAEFTTGATTLPTTTTMTTAPTTAASVTTAPAATAPTTRPVVTVGPFDRQIIPRRDPSLGFTLPGFPVPNLDISDDPAVRQRFFDQAVNLLAAAGEGGERRAIGLIELPTDGKVLVAELADVESVWSPDAQFTFRQLSARDLAQQRVTALIRDWFSFEGISARLNYRPPDRQG